MDGVSLNVLQLQFYLRMRFHKLWSKGRGLPQGAGQSQAPRPPCPEACHWLKNDAAHYHCCLLASCCWENTLARTGESRGGPAAAAGRDWVGADCSPRHCPQGRVELVREEDRGGTVRGRGERAAGRGGRAGSSAPPSRGIFGCRADRVAGRGNHQIQGSPAPPAPPPRPRYSPAPAPHPRGRSLAGVRGWAKGPSLGTGLVPRWVIAVPAAWPGSASQAQAGYSSRTCEDEPAARLAA